MWLLVLHRRLKGPFLVCCQLALVPVGIPSIVCVESQKLSCRAAGLDWHSGICLLLCLLCMRVPCPLCAQAQVRAHRQAHGWQLLDSQDNALLLYQHGRQMALQSSAPLKLWLVFLGHLMVYLFSLLGQASSNLKARQGAGTLARQRVKPDMAAHQATPVG